MGELDQLPPVLLNTVPKSGTNLVNQILLGMPGCRLNGYFFFEGLEKHFTEHFRIVEGALPGFLYLGHVYHSREWAEMLERSRVKTIFLSRDLRDILVSLTYFILKKLPDYYVYADLRALQTQKERYLLLINGVRDYPNIRDWFKLFSGWRNEPNVLSITFEELMASAESRRHTIRQMAEYIWEGLVPPIPLSEIAQQMEGNIDPSKSGTYRKGEIGSWREEFDDEVKEAFKRVAGDVLIETGYEKDNNW